jgi:uncharacterized protein YkwD
MQKHFWKMILATIGVLALSSHFTHPVSPQATAMTTSLQLSQNWLERFNYYRQAAGVPAVVESPAYSADLAKHVTYMLLNVPSEGLWHGETPGRPGYTPEGAQAAAESNLAFGYPTPAASIDGWMASIHHRFGMLNPDLITTGFGFGCDSQACSAGLNVIRGLVWDSNPRPNGVFYPGPGQMDVNTDVTLTWQFQWEPTIMLKTASLRNSAGEAVAISTTSPPNGDYFNMVSVNPNAPLSPHTTYTASLTVQRGVQELSQTWSFTTLLFGDVPADYWSSAWIARLYEAGITGGCGNGNYCPEDTVTRDQMAVFLERGIHGAAYNPPAVGNTTGFGDVSTGYWAASWIKQLVADGITSGCGPGMYCPEAPVTRAQMAVFLLRSKHGADYSPPAVGSTTGFNDVPTSYWAAAWIKQLVAEGITAGCGAGMYCPEDPVTRAEMAVFLVRAFALP